MSRGPAEDGRFAGNRQQTEQLLLAQFTAAAKVYESARAESTASRRQVKGDLNGSSNGETRPKAAAAELEALREYRQALKAYSDFMLYGKTPTDQQKVRFPARDILTPRELEVLILIAEGLSSKELADQLGVSFKTVVCHRTRIMDKLDIHNVAGLVRYAIREKLITP